MLFVVDSVWAHILSEVLREMDSAREEDLCQMQAKHPFKDGEPAPHQFGIGIRHSNGEGLKQWQQQQRWRAITCLPLCAQPGPTRPGIHHGPCTEERPCECLQREDLRDRAF